MSKILKIAFGLGFTLCIGEITPDAKAANHSGWVEAKKAAVRVYDECAAMGVSRGKCEKDSFNECYKLENGNAQRACEGLLRLFFVSENHSGFDLGALRVTKDSGETDLNLNPEDEKSIFNKFINIMASVAGIIGVFFYCAAGLFFITSHGDENQIQQAKNIIKFTTLGMLVLMGAYIIVNFVLGALFL